MQLRPYQKTCFDKAVAWMLHSTEPCLIDAAPAAGKSYMIASIANEIHKMSGGKRVLCLAPSATLVKQNYEKYLLTGEPASIFSASAGRKELRHHVVFGTPLTVKNKITAFKNYAMVVVDECHSIPPTVQYIINQMRVSNPKLRVLGLSGTPFQLGNGYIFREWPDGRINGLDVANDPYFTKCVYRVSAQEMLEQGFITPMQIGTVGVQKYDTSGLVVEHGQFTPESLHQTFEGKGRMTADIVADVVSYARHIPGGCMFFAATIPHAREIMASLPPENSGLVTGECKKMIEPYREQKIKYIVSVGTLTTGFDVSHTSVIATLRRTMSAALLQQILGRAWRLDDNKPMSYWLDYAGNCEEHFPNDDIYTPEIKAKRKKEGGDTLDAACPECGYVNEFKHNPDYPTYDENGYALDVMGLPIMTEYGKAPAHFGRRCMGVLPKTYDRCGYRWTFKICEECEAENDIAARYCCKCKCEIVDPHEKLQREFVQRKKDPFTISTDYLKSWEVIDTLSSKGNAMWKVTWHTEYRTFTSYFVKGMKKTNMILSKTNNLKMMPMSITFYKNKSTDFWEVVDVNRSVDEIPS